MKQVTYSVELLEATINKQVERIEALETALRTILEAALRRIEAHNDNPACFDRDVADVAHATLGDKAAREAELLP